MNTRLQQQLDFIVELDRLKQIVRQTYLADGSRLENDSEHSWHLALMCAVLAEYSNEPIDVLKTMTMVIIHDVVEIDAGDTYAYDSAGNKTKRDREVKAANRLFGLLPKEQAQEFMDLWEEFEAGVTPEARFANTVDKIQPVLLTDYSGGKSWRQHQVKESQIMERNAKTGEGSEVLWEYCRQLITKNIENGTIQSGE